MGAWSAILLLAAQILASPDWSVSVEGRPLELGTVNISTQENNEPAVNLQRKGVWYQYGSFVLRRPVDVRIACLRPLAQLRILPESAAPKGVRREGNAIVFRAERPFALSFCPQGRTGALHLFATTPAAVDCPPDRDAAQVIRYGAGDHETRVIAVRSNQTLILDEGARVYGHLDVKGTNILVCGAGLISGAKFARFKGPGAYSNTIQDATNVVVRGIAFADPYGWTVGIRHARAVTLENVKVLGGRMINDDGIDIINSSDVTIRDAFVRTQDDNIALKGLGYVGKTPCFDPVENVRITGCTLWTDQANTFRIGFECDAPHMRNIAISNIDVLASSPLPVKRDAFWGHAVIKAQASGGLEIADLDVRDVRVRAAGESIHLIQLESALTWSRRFGEGRHRYHAGGTIRNCRFADITISEPVEGFGASAADGFGGWIDVAGRSERECVSNVTFTRLKRGGRPLTADDPCVFIGPATSSIRW